MLPTTRVIIAFFILIGFTTGCSIPEPEKNDPSAEIKAIEASLTPSIQIKGEASDTFTLTDRMDFFNVPGVSLAVIRNGRLRWAKGYGLANPETNIPVDTSTIFQAGSISKPVAALAILQLMEAGKVNLDTDVNVYLRDWKVPENEFTQQEKVTLRRLLTHSAGMTVHGFPGYTQADTFPTDEQVLDGFGNTAPVRVDTTPGAIWRYSGGGYTVMEQVVEAVSGLSFADYMEQNVLVPLGMVNSTYAQPLPEDRHAQASSAFDNDGQLIEGHWHNYPEQAAAGLWTTPADLARYCIALQKIFAGKKNGLLQPETVKAMLTKDQNGWGLGPSLAGTGDSLRFHHGGKNAGFTNNLIAFARTGDAVIIMTNADKGWPLQTEIMRAISNQYGWGLSKPRMIEPVDLPNEKLKRLAGKYQYVEPVPDIGDYQVNLSVHNQQLIIDDPNDGDRVLLLALTDSTFIDLEEGETVHFISSSEPLRFLWNDTFQFYRVEAKEVK